jgi:pyrimidine deaminase RibD-like protein
MATANGACDDQYAVCRVLITVGTSMVAIVCSHYGRTPLCVENLSSRCLATVLHQQ